MVDRKIEKGTSRIKREEKSKDCLLGAATGMPPDRAAP
jgi:hypothetical protein